MTRRDRDIHLHVLLALRHTGMTREHYAADVVDLYQQRTAPAARGIEFHTPGRGEDPYQVMRANAQLVFRMIDGPVRLASELEEAVVLALPEPFRSNCLRDLAARYGLLAAEQPAAGQAGRMATVSTLAREFGEAMSALSHTLADGRLDQADAVAAPAVVAELDDLIAAATTLRAAHSALLNDKPAAPLRAVPADRY